MADDYTRIPGQGILFQNQRKRHGDSLPDFVGTIVDHSGDEFRLVAWWKRGPLGSYLTTALNGKIGGSKKPKKDAFESDKDL